MLILCAEDYTGASPVSERPGRTTSPSTRTPWRRTASASTSTTSTPAAARRPPASASSRHYDAVVWYTGDDVITREPGWVGGNGSRLAMDESLQCSVTYLNEGGRVLYSGKNAGLQYATPRLQLYDPTAANAQCSALPPTTDPRRCLILFGSTSGDLQNDVLEYWFGGVPAQRRRRSRRRRRHLQRPRHGHAVHSLTARCSTGRTARRTGDNANSFIATSGILPADEFPQFESWVVGALRPAGRAVRPAHGRELRVLPDRGRLLQEPVADGHRPRRGRQR